MNLTYSPYRLTMMSDTVIQWANLFWDFSCSVNLLSIFHSLKISGSECRQPACASGSVASLKAYQCTDCQAGEAPNAERSQCMRCGDGQVSVRQQVAFLDL